jgi:hypothetical protein
MFKNPAFWLGLYGSILSTILAIGEYMKRRRRVKVRASYRTLVGANPADVLLLTAVNVGHRPVTLTVGGLLLNSGQSLGLVGGGTTPEMGNLPARLDDGAEVTLTFELLEPTAGHVAAPGRRPGRDSDVRVLR